MKDKPILCVDFDGVLHSYSSGWRGADVILDPPVPGAMDFLMRASAKFRVHIYSARSGQPGGIEAMQRFIMENLPAHPLPKWFFDLEWPTEKPPALVTLDDRAVCFTGTFPDPEELASFKPWYFNVEGEGR